MKDNCPENTRAFMNEVVMAFSKKMEESILETNTVAQYKNNFWGPISEDDLIKAMDKFKAIKSFEKWAFIIVEDFYEDFSNMLLWPATTKYTKWLSTLHWLPVYKKDLTTAYKLAVYLLKEKNMDKVHIVERTQVITLDKKFLTLIDNPFWFWQPKRPQWLKDLDKTFSNLKTK